MIVRKVNDHGVVHRLCAAELLVESQLLDIHHVRQAEERVDVDARLQVLREGESFFHEFNRLRLLHSGVGLRHCVDLSDHLAHESESIGDEEHFLLNVHDYDALGELDQQLDCLGDVVKLEEILLLLQVEEDLTDDDAEGEVEDLIVEFLHVELEVVRQHPLQELDQVFNLD